MCRSSLLSLISGLHVCSQTTLFRHTEPLTSLRIIIYNYPLVSPLLLLSSMSSLVLLSASSSFFFFFSFFFFLLFFFSSSFFSFQIRGLRTGPRSAVVSASDCGSEGLGFESHQSHVGFFGPGRLLPRAGSAMASTSRMRL